MFRIKKSFSLKWLFALTAVVALILVCCILARDFISPVTRHRMAAYQWENSLDNGDQAKIFEFQVGELHFGVANRVLRKRGDGWVVTPQKLEAGKFFVFPPGRIVEGMSEAFSNFRSQYRINEQTAAR